MEYLFLVVGLVLIIVGASWLTDGSVALAERFHIPEFIVGLTIVAVGTSMPELTVSLLSAMGGSGEMAIGNVVGSNLFNIFFILGASSLICPLAIKGIGTLDWVALLGCSMLLFAFGRTGHKITRTEGIVMLSLYILYMVALVMGWQISL